MTTYMKIHRHDGVASSASSLVEPAAVEPTVFQVKGTKKTDSGQ